MQNLLGFSRNRKQSWAFHTLEAKFITRWACGWSLVDHIRVDHMKTLLQIDDQRSMSKPYDAGNCTWSRLQLNVLTLRIRLRRKYISESVSSVRSTFKLNLWKTWSWNLIGPDSDDQIMINVIMDCHSAIIGERGGGTRKRMSGVVPLRKYGHFSCEKMKGWCSTVNLSP